MRVNPAEPSKLLELQRSKALPSRSERFEKTLIALRDDSESVRNVLGRPETLCKAGEGVGEYQTLPTHLEDCSVTGGRTVTFSYVDKSLRQQSRSVCLCGNVAS